MTASDLYAALDRLIQLPDAFVEGGRTAIAIAYLHGQLDEIERREADTWERAFDASLAQPIGVGRKTATELRRLLEKLRQGPNE